MIKVDIASIEKIVDILIKTASDTEEVLYRIKKTSDEMYDDTTLSNFVQSIGALEAVSAATEQIERGNGTLYSLKNIMRSVVDMYQENEQSNISALKKMHTVMECTDLNLHAAMTSNKLVYVEHSDAVIMQNEVQELLTKNKEQLSTVNLAAVAEIVNEEYAITTVKELKKEI